MKKDLPNSKPIVDKLCELWHPLDARQRQLISDHLTVRLYKRKEMVYECGKVPTTLFFCVEGAGYILRETSKHHRILSLIGPGDFFGYRAHFTPSGRYYTSAFCHADSIIATLPYDIIDQLIVESPSLGLFFTKALALMLGIADTRDEVLTQMHVRGRLAQSLVYLQWKFGFEADGMTLCATPTRAELGHLANITTSNVIRTLSQFVKEGLLETNNKKILIPDMAKLKKVLDE